MPDPGGCVRCVKKVSGDLSGAALLILQQPGESDEPDGDQPASEEI